MTSSRYPEIDHERDAATSLGGWRSGHRRRTDLYVVVMAGATILWKPQSATHWLLMLCRSECAFRGLFSYQGRVPATQASGLALCFTRRNHAADPRHRQSGWRSDRCSGVPTFQIGLS